MAKQIDEGAHGKGRVAMKQSSAETGEFPAKEKADAGVSVYENLTIVRDEYRREPRFI